MFKWCIALIVVVVAVGGCDKKSESSPGNSVNTQAPIKAPASQSSLAPVMAVATPNPADSFKVFAREFLVSLAFEYLKASSATYTDQPGLESTFTINNDTAKIDVKKTDSLLNPLIGTIKVEKHAIFVRKDATAQGAAASAVGLGSSTVEDTMTFAPVDSGQWEFINGRSYGKLTTQDINDISSRNPDGVSSKVVDLDLTGNKIIVDAVTKTNEKICKKTGSSPLDKAKP